MNIIKKLFSLDEEIRSVYLFTLIRVLILNLFGLFVPIIIYKKTNSIALVAEYLSLMYGLLLFLAVLLLLFLTKFLPLEYFYIISMFSNMLQIFLLSQVKTIDAKFVAIIAGLAAIGIVFYWLPRHFSFIGASTAHIAETVSLLNLLTTLLNITLPMIASLILIKQSFSKYSFILMMILLPLAILPLIFIRKVHKVEIKLRRRPKHFLLFLLEGFSGSVALLMIIYVYIYSHSILLFGAVATFSSLASSLASYFLAKYIDKYKEFSLASLGFLVRANAATVSAIIPNVMIISIARVIMNFFSVFSDPPFHGFLYSFSHIEGKEQIIYREFALALSRFISFSLLYFIDPRWLMLFGALMTIIYSFIFYFISNYYARLNKSPYDLE